jgi:sacsin
VKISELPIGGDTDGLPESSFQSLHFINHRVPLDLAMKLQIDSFRDRKVKDELQIEEESDGEYTPREELITVLTDSLRRYPLTSTFTEYIANAEDCGATEIQWLLDDCTPRTYPTTKLLSKELECVQGSALYVYNDRIFTENDFEGFKQIGRGSKSGDETSIGMFGRGAITMYHFTDVPMILSGSALLILDPQQNLLPRNKLNRRMVGVKVSLERARRLFVDQLVPFEGLFGYKSSVDFFDGTIVRFPLRDRNSKSSIVETPNHLAVAAIKTLLEAHAETASKVPIFPQNIRMISDKLRSDDVDNWRVIAISLALVHGSIQKMVIRLFSRKNDLKNDHYLEKYPDEDYGSPTGDVWWFANYDNSVPATMRTTTILKGMRIQSGVAACPENSRTRHSIFCT